MRPKTTYEKMLNDKLIAKGQAFTELKHIIYDLWFDEKYRFKKGYEMIDKLKQEILLLEFKYKINKWDFEEIKKYKEEQ